MDESQPKSALRRKIARFAAAAAVIQAVVAVAVLIHSRLLRARIRSRRPPHYPVRSFPAVEIGNGADRARIFIDGDELLDDIIDAIDHAEDRVHIETFIWVADRSGVRLRDALVRAAERGVAIHVLYDWALSTKGLDQGFFPAPIEAFAFRPLGFSRAGLSLANVVRDHRKLVVIDGQVAYSGGYNFGDQYLGWRDTHVRLEGDCVANLETAFIDFWNDKRTDDMPVLTDQPIRTFDDEVLVHRNDPSVAVFPIRGMYLEAIDRASQRIWITNAYFVPDRAFRAKLREAAERGVDVRIILPEHSNHPLTDVLAHGMFEEMLASGVRIFLYRDFMVHAKTATIDRHWTTIGTANLDRWSMLGNYEINLEFVSEALAAQMEAVFLLDLESSEEVTLSAWSQRPLRMKASERTLRALAPLL